MCGIVAYIGNKQAYEIVIKGLKRLEYRGYDSCGFAVIDKIPGAVFPLRGLCRQRLGVSIIGIAVRSQEAPALSVAAVHFKPDAVE